jgi:hypothetical protein
MYDGRTNGCGPFGGYGEDLTLCCAGGESLLQCDSSKVTLISQPCSRGYSCVQHKNYGNNAFGGLGIYAECERV